MTTYPYPSVLDPADLWRLLPPHVRGGGWGQMLRECMDEVSALDAEVADLVSQYVYRESASGAVLDALGSWVGEARGGLDESEYRQVVLGALSAVRCRQAWTWEAARAMLERLAAVRPEDLTLEMLAGCQTRAFGLVRYHPSDALVRRMDRVLARAHPPGWAWSLHLYPEGALIADEQPGADIGLASWYVSGTGGAA